MALRNFLFRKHLSNSTIKHVASKHLFLHQTRVSLSTRVTTSTVASITCSMYNLPPIKKVMYLIQEVGFFHQVKHKESLMCSMRSMSKGKCYAKCLFSMSLWIVNKLVFISFMAKTKSQMKILC